MVAKQATKPQTKHADKMIPPSSSQKYLQMYLRVCLQNILLDGFPSLLDGLLLIYGRVSPQSLDTI